MSSSTNDLTKWSDEQLRENEDNDNELFEKKSAERGGRGEAESRGRGVEEGGGGGEGACRGGRMGAELSLGPVKGETAEGDGKWDCGVLQYIE
ncbi:hypothetical protein PAXRUDRAFT_19815 [Paxillus rubicundulus Ve08.2h10]|uniref:Uncharacterized protein n=1 Tax=Paxillus rubicundulus Ve08.2h10 TaxID=930991 RepID=A0A0D0DBA2_9AGAM|nr:hypothetical protein PAXRUDRAFT_19815 [Paxillus rubicundulus Ve08.2h10]